MTEGRARDRLGPIAWAAALCLLLGCAASRTPWPIVPNEGLDADAFPGAGAVVLERSARIRILSGAGEVLTYRSRVHTKTQIVAPSGRQAGRVVVPLGWDDRLLSMEARSYDGGRDPAEDGVAWAPADGVAYFPMAIGAAILYSDSRFAILDVPGAGVGRVVEVRYEIESSGVAGLPIWTFDDPLHPVLRSRLAVEAPADWNLRWAFSRWGRFSDFGPAEQRADPLRSWHWELSDVEPVGREPFALPAHQLSPRLRLAAWPEAGGPGGIREWGDLGRAFRELSGAGEEPPEGAIESLERSLVEKPMAAEDPRDAPYRFVRDRIRYVAIYQGIEALQPHPAEETWRARFGDCKDMVSLLVSLYRTRGVRAWPALLGTRDYGLAHPEVPSFGDLNHVIVALEEGGARRYRFVDPTARFHPFGRLPWADQGRRVVVVRDTDVDVVETPVDDPAENREEVIWTVGKGGVELVARLGGESAAPWRPLAASPPGEQPRRTAIRERYLSHLEPGQIDAVSVAFQPADQADSVEVRATVRSWSPRVESRSHSFLPLSPFLRAGREVRVPAERASPVALGFPYTLIERLTLSLVPGEALLARLPRRERIQNDVGSYSMSAELRGDRVFLSRELVMRGDVVSGDRLPAVRELAEAITLDTREAVVLGQGRDRGPRGRR